MIAERLKNLSQACAEVEAMIISSPENRRYLSGFSGSSGALLIHDGVGELITDSRYWERAGMEAPELELIQQRQPLWPQVAAVVRERGYRTVGFEVDKISVATWQGLLQSTPQVKWVGLSERVERLRMLKTAEEIRHLGQAAQIASTALERALARMRPGCEEHEIAVELEWQMRKLGSEGLSFDTIVASGPRSALPHARPSRRRIMEGDLLTIDFGATVAGYHSDETVTVGVGEVHGQARDIFDVVCLAQSRAMEQVAGGFPVSEVDRIARETIDGAGYGSYFGHSTGHGVGLEVHEAPLVALHSSDVRLEPGMVLTVEPGIYLPGKFGVRLEDTLVVTGDGSERLTKIEKVWREL